MLGRVIAHIHALLSPLLSSREVWKVQLDTYQRELERYGSQGMVGSETVFYQDSLLILRLLEEEAFAEKPEIRFLTALKNIDKWLTLFEMDEKEKIGFCQEMATAFSREYDPKLKRKLDKQYREWSDRIADFMDDKQYEDLFQDRKNVLLGLSLQTENLSSYIHMSLNRWFPIEQRLMEYMLYVFYEKYFTRYNAPDTCLAVRYFRFTLINKLKYYPMLFIG